MSSRAATRSRRTINASYKSTLILIALLHGCATPPDDLSRAEQPPEVLALDGGAHKICQLTGETDNGFAPPRPVRNNTNERIGLSGTDLGSSFSGPAPGTIHFLFGDSVARNPALHRKDDDAVAVARADDDPEKCLELHFYSDSHSDYTPIRLEGFELGSFEVPTAGFVVNGATFASFAIEARGNPRHPTRSVLALDEHFPISMTFSYIEDLSAAKMLNVSAVPVDDHWKPGPHPTRVLLFGTGAYRHSSNVYLAAFPLTRIRQSTDTWFAGRERSGGAHWSAREKDARPLFEPAGTPCMAELSVSWNLYLNEWLMLYNCSQPRGIVFRVAATPWGPWSAPRVLFDPRAGEGYCVFMHDAAPERHCPPQSPNPNDDLIVRRGGADAYGGEYGPYVIDAFTRGDRADATTTIYFTLSTWNPYEVVLMKARLRSTAAQGALE